MVTINSTYYPGSEKGPIFADCSVTIEARDTTQNCAHIEIDVTDHRGAKVSLKFEVVRANDRVTVSLIEIGDELAGYALCVARKVSGALVDAAIDCWSTTDTWPKFFDCMKKKARNIGKKTAWALWTCTNSITGSGDGDT